MVATVFLLLLVCLPFVHPQAFCPSGTPSMDIYSDSISLGLQSSIAIQKGVDNKNYNYTLPSPFPRPPTVAIAINQFQAYQGIDLAFSVKHISGSSTTVVSFAIRTPWKYTNWSQITVNFIAEARSDVETGYYQRDTGSVGGQGVGKSQSLFLPFTQQWSNPSGLVARVFLNGFEITTVTSANGFSPYEIQLQNAVASLTGLSVVLSVTSSTQVNNVCISYFVYNPSSVGLQITDGFIERSSLQGSSSITLENRNKFGVIRSGIYGLSGLVASSSNTDPQISLLVSQNLSVVVDTFSAFYSYLGFQYVLIAQNPCLNCQSAPLLYNNACVPSCPSGTVSTGYSCESCPPNSVLNNNRCVCINDFYNISGQCTTCPSNMRWNGSQCVACGTNAAWSGNVCSCITGYYNISNVCQSCPGGQQWNGTDCTNIQGQLNSQVILPAQQTTFQQPSFQQASNQQAVTQSQTSSTQPLGNSSSCLAGVSKWNGTACVCILAGFTWNGKSCVQNSVTPTSQTQGSTSQPQATASPQTTTQTPTGIQSAQSCPTGITQWNGQQCICLQPNTYFNGQICVATSGSQQSSSSYSQQASTSSLYSQQQAYPFAQQQTSTYPQLNSSPYSQATNVPTGVNGISSMSSPYSGLGSVYPVAQTQQQTGSAYSASQQPQSGSCPLGFVWNGVSCVYQAPTPTPKPISQPVSLQAEPASRCPQGWFWSGTTCLFGSQ